MAGKRKKPETQEEIDEAFRAAGGTPKEPEATKTEVMVKRPVGAPRLYDPAYFSVLNEHLKLWVATKYAIFKKTGVGEIWLGDFAFEEGFSRQTLSNLADPNGAYKKFNAEFAETYSWAKTAQESWAIFDEKISFNIRKLLLSACHGLNEKVEVQAPAPPALPAGFTANFNFYLSQMGESPIALPDIQEAEVVEDPQDFGKSFKQFAAK